ncbi:MAG: M20/M25/M40 family metallo-hydrolase [Acidobacteriota bacterium]
MQRTRTFALAAVTLAAFGLAGPALLAHGGHEPVDLETVSSIRDEGLKRSQVMDIAAHLTDVIGPRLTGTPALEEANEWTRQWLEDAGLERAEIVGFPWFGEGWEFERSEVRIVSPFVVPVSAIPEAWTPGTDGTVRGKAMRLKVESAKDLEDHEGKLAGVILFLDEARAPEEPEGGPFRRYTGEQLDELACYDLEGRRRGGNWRERARKRWEAGEELRKRLLDEGVVATVELSSRNHGIVRVMGGGSRGASDRNRGIPSLVMAAEHYHRILRLMEEGTELELEIDIEAKFLEGVDESFNTYAEIPGSDLADQVVLAGAHLDSWHAGTGATDNAAGVAVVMEAVRILRALDVKPRRTVRVALWTGEEQGLFGSRAYVKKRLATRPEPTDEEQLALPSFLRDTTWPIQPKADHAKFSAYFNLDNGAGKIRGIYAQDNAAVKPIFEAWLEPFADLGATTVTGRSTGGTDHLAFDAVGLPGFQFIQDGLDYWSRTHHTELDTFDHLHEADLKQASVVLASFLYHAAMREELLPRKAMPQKPPEKKKRSGGRDGALRP